MSDINESFELFIRAIGGTIGDKPGQFQLQVKTVPVLDNRRWVDTRLYRIALIFSEDGAIQFPFNNYHWEARDLIERMHWGINTLIQHNRHRKDQSCPGID